MATDTLPELKPSQRKKPSSEQFIDRQLRRTQLQVRVVDIVASLVVWLVAMLGSLLVLALCDHWLVSIGTVGRWLALLALVAGSGYYFAVQLGPLLWRRINSAYAAKVIEDAEPSLKNSLLNFLLLRGNSSGVPEVVVDALRERAASDLTNAPVDRAVDHTPLIRIGYVLCGVMVVFAAYKLLSPKDPFRTVARVLAPWAEIARPSRVQVVSIEPGDKEVYQGQTITISADISGARSSDVVELVYSTADGQTVDAVAAMAHSAGVQYRCAFPPATSENGIQQDVLYHVRAGDAESPQYRLKVLPSPRIEVEQVELHYPAYTRRPPQTLRQGDIRAVEGTLAIVRAKANQEIASAYIEFDPSHNANTRSPTLPMTSDGMAASAEFRLERLADGSARHTTYQVRLRSRADMTNDRPTLHRIEALADLAPEIEILAPMERRVELPLDRTLKVELRGRDPDFGLRKITLELSRGEDDLEPAALHDSSEGQRGPVNASYVVSPHKLGLQPGDDLLLVGVAEDNRHDGAGELAANVNRTERYTIHITAPEERENKPSDEPMTDDGEGEGSNERPPQANKPEENERPNPPKKPETNKPDKRNDNKSKPEKPEKTDTGENKTDSTAENSEDKPGETPQTKPQTKPENKKPGEKSPNDKKPQGNEKKQQQGGNEGGDDTGDSESSSDDSQGGSSGGQPGEKKPGSKPGGESGGASSDDATGEKTEGTESSDSSGSNNTGSNSKTSKGTNKKPGSPNNAGNDTGEGGESGNESADGSENSGTPAKSTSGKPNQARKPASAGNSEQPADERPQHAGEVIEKLNQELEKDKSLKEKLEQQERAERANEDKPSGENTGAGATQKPNGAKGTQNKPEGASGKPGEENGAGEGANPENAKPEDKPGTPSGKPGDKSTQPKPGEELNGAEQPMVGGQKPGEKSKPGDKTKPGNEATNGTGEKKNDQGTGAGSEKPSNTKAPGDEKSTDDASGDQPGQGDQADPGSGKRPEKPNPSGEPQSKSQDKSKTPKPDGGKDEEESPSASPSSKKQSNSTGENKGDEVGGGGQGAGQQAEQAGKDTPGSNTSSDTGAGQSKEPGKGETGDKGGQGPKAERPTGQSGNEEGPGSATKPGEQGTKPDPNKGGSKAGGSGQLPPNAKPQQNESKGRPNGDVATGGGAASDDEPVSGQPPKVDIADTEAENLEYAKKSTDLALRYLKDQKDNPDPDLLKKLGWTKDDLNAFLQRWESLKNSAKEGAEAKDELNDAYKSLGLRPAADKRKSAGAGNDATRGNRDAGARSEPPPGYAEQFKAFRKGAGK